MKVVKRLEIGLKHAASAGLRAALTQPPRTPEPPYGRILFFRYGGIGDMILSLPVFRAVRARFPHAWIEVLCDAKNRAPLAGTGLVDDIAVYDKKPQRVARLMTQLRERRYDYICNLIAYPSFTFGMLARLIGPGAVRAAGDQDRFAYLYNRLIDLPPKREVHMLDRLHLLAADLTTPGAAAGPAPWIEYDASIKAQAGQLHSWVVATLAPEQRPFRLAVVNLTAGLERREWPLGRCAEFLHVAIDRYASLIDGWALVTSPGRVETTARLAAEIGRRSVTALPLVPDFRVLMEFLRFARFLVTPDTALAHAASAVGTPVVDLMIGENVNTWAPVGVTHRVVAAADPLSIHKLPVDDVVRGCDDLLSRI